MEIKNAKIIRTATEYFLSVEVNGKRKNVARYGSVAPDLSRAEDDYLLYVQGFSDASKELGSIMNKITFSASVENDSVGIEFHKPISHTESLTKSTTKTTRVKQEKKIVGESGNSLFAFRKGRI